MWPFRTKQTLVEHSPAANKERPHAWTTHAEEADDMPRRSLQDVFNELYEKQVSVMRSGIANGTMDASDIDSDGQGGGSSLKRAYAYRDEAVSEALMMWYARQGFIGHQLCAILDQHWLIDKACKMPARDAIRNGFEIVSADGDEVDEARLKLMKRWDKRMHLKQNLEQFIHMGRVFGVRVVIFKVNSTDSEYYEKPFNPDGVTPGSYKGMVQIDPYWCAPLLDKNAASQPDTMHFYEPTWWIINGKRYHRTHLMIFRNGELPDVLKPTYLYGGVPVPQRIMERVYAAERTANEGPQLTLTKRSTIFYTDLTKALGNWTKFIANLLKWRDALDNYGVKVADKTDDKIEQIDTSLADLDNVIMNQYQLVAAAANVPATKLLGTAPKGFDATGEYDESNYHEELETIQANDMLPMIERHHLLVDRSIVCPKLKCLPMETTVEFNPLDTPTAVELSTINLNKAQTDAALQPTGAIDEIDIRNRLRKDTQSGYAGIDEAIRPPSQIVPDPLGMEPPGVGAPVPKVPLASPGSAAGFPNTAAAASGT